MLSFQWTLTPPSVGQGERMGKLGAGKTCGLGRHRGVEAILARQHRRRRFTNAR
ncbi:MAG: hypothetical protein HY686_03635 [Chloroflexi bacterium]|nr:hypothetical protein [Chloroflexota bacterium]